jgi:hypothetical protein
MRKLLSFAVATAICIGGLWLFIEQAFWSNIVYGKWLLAAGFMIAVGGYWLWVDFLAPALGIKAEE